MNPFTAKQSIEVRKILKRLNEYFANVSSRSARSGYPVADIDHKIYEKLLTAIPERDRAKYQDEIPFLNGKICRRNNYFSKVDVG